MSAYALKTGSFESMHCGECGVTFYVPAEFRRVRLEKKTEWFCPNGHCRVFLGETEAEKLKKQLEAKESGLQWERQHRERAERQLSAARGQVTKIKNRVSAGVCPCCNRSFQNLSRHMAGQHPGWKAQDVG